jgi:hypothetical protein
MSTFLFTYRVPQKPLRETLAELDEAGRTERMAAWNGWFESMGASVRQQGHPVNDARTVGNAGADTRVGGYSLITADDFDAAIELAKGCPGLEWGGGIEIGEIMEMPAQPATADARASAQV